MEVKNTVLNSKKMTIDDVAEALGVSKTTVSRAISGKGRISLETREKVMAYIEKYNYKPNVLARGLANSKTYNIGVVIPEDYEVIDLPFFQKCLMGLSEAANYIGYDVVLIMSSNGNTGNIRRILGDHKVDGVVLTRTLLKDEAVEILEEYEMPYVVIGTSMYENVTQVDHDHRAACKELTSILLMKNLTQMALIGGDENHVITQTRLQGFTDAFREQGVPLNSSNIYLGIDSQIQADSIVEALIEKRIECIVCMDDRMCGYVLNKLKEEKVSVPGEIKVASFYNSNILDKYLTPVTSLQFDVHEIGIQSGKVLLGKIEGKEIPEKTFLEYEVVLKDSTK